MKRRLRCVAIAFAVFLAACANPSENPGRAKPVSFEPPPRDYVHLARAAVGPTSDTVVIDVGNNAKLEEIDGLVALGFQLSYGLAVQQVQAASLETTGSGLSVDDSIRIVNSEDDLSDALNVIARRNPDWKPTIGRLYRSPERDYIMLVEFKSSAGVTPLYFDVTEWAKGFIPT